MTDERPPWPGTKPARLEFPFDRAQAAIDAIHDLVADLEDLRAAVDQGVADLHGGAFEGEFADWFTGSTDDLVRELDARITLLEGHADDLAAHRDAARLSVDDRDAARRAWDRAHARWANWEPAA